MVKLKEALQTIASIIASLTIIVGGITAAVTFSLTLAPQNELSQWIKDGLTNVTQENSEPNTAHYVYYERGVDGKLTHDGRLTSIGVQEPEYFSNLKVGQILIAHSTVRIRTGATSKEENVIGRIPRGRCIRIVELTKELKPPIIPIGKSAGWIKSVLSSCEANSR